MKYTFASILFLALLSCQSNTQKNNISYSDDLALLSLNTNYIELEANTYPGKICVCPEYQGKVMTSTSNYNKNLSNGWINRSVLSNNYNGNGSNVGGEDRLWIGPLGGQHTFYCGQQKPLADENWKVPACMNEEAYEIVGQTKKGIKLKKEMSLTNFIGTRLNMLIERDISILEKDKIEINLNIDVSDLDVVAYSSEHTLTNLDSVQWHKSTGLATIWSIGKFEGSDRSTVIIPILKSNHSQVINTYLGPLNKQRLKRTENHQLFKTDGKYRSKIGIPANIAPSIFGNYKPETNTLTIVQYQHKGDSLYFNSDVSIQENPYNGESIQVYNHGSMDYSPVNKASFYELESTAPFKELAPKETLHHYHRVYHLTGSVSKLNVISEKLLGTKLTSVEL